jgi:hypothetical protein
MLRDELNAVYLRDQSAWTIRSFSGAKRMKSDGARSGEMLCDGSLRFGFLPRFEGSTPAGARRHYRYGEPVPDKDRRLAYPQRTLATCCGLRTSR